jgi:hypothetical protein
VKALALAVPALILAAGGYFAWKAYERQNANKATSSSAKTPSPFVTKTLEPVTGEALQLAPPAPAVIPGVYISSANEILVPREQIPGRMTTMDMVPVGSPGAATLTPEQAASVAAYAAHMEAQAIAEARAYEEKTGSLWLGAVTRPTVRVMQ